MEINTALILCAGFGKRLNPLTLKTPKPLLELKNITMLERCINLIEELGINRIILNTFHLENQIIEFIENKKFPMDIQIIKDGKNILNTGGGILNMITNSKEKIIKTFIHGFLHLLGFDHVKNKDYLKMLKEEEKIFKSVTSKIK